MQAKIWNFLQYTIEFTNNFKTIFTIKKKKLVPIKVIKKVFFYQIQPPKTSYHEKSINEQN